MLLPRVGAADSTTSFVSPATWRKPGIVTTPAERARLAQAAIEKSVSQLSSTTGQVNGAALAGTAVLYSQMATFDLLTNQTNYKDKLLTLFKLVDSLMPGFANSEYVYTGLTYGYAAATAYAAYKDPSFLEWAQENWQFGLNYTLSQQELDGTAQSPRNFTLQATCLGATMAGGSFTNTDFNDAKINALSTGGVLVNSALLAESNPNNATYLTAAQASANFIRLHLVSPQDIVVDTISAQQIDNCGILNPNLFSYNQGLAVEGLAILSSLDPGNADTQNVLYSTIIPAATNPDWHTADGIIVFGDAKGGDDRLIRGAIAAYNRNPNNPDLRAYLRDYIGVQYNAVLDLATAGGDVYSESWLGPPTPYSPDGQSLAISVLLAGMSLQNDTSTSIQGGGNSTSSDNGPDPPQPTHKSSTGAIAGGVIGGLVLIALLIGALFFIRRRNRARHSTDFVVDYEPTSAAPMTGVTGSSFSARARPISDFTDRQNVMSQSDFGTISPFTTQGDPNHSRNPSDDLLVRMLAARLQSAGPVYDQNQAPPGYQEEPANNHSVDFNHNNSNSDNSSSADSSATGNNLIPRRNEKGGR
ncbi:hypothetical protein C8J56DRAFT_507793 [Mycena floridula]|nr:hypothetical protein C8J56DRAFT_507793 [Mycena floridula]